MVVNHMIPSSIPCSVGADQTDLRTTHEPGRHTFLYFGSHYPAFVAGPIADLFVPAREGNVAAARMLISLGMTVNFVDNCGSTALDYAIVHDRLEMLRFLHRWEPRSTHSVFRRVMRWKHF